MMQTLKNGNRSAIRLLALPAFFLLLAFLTAPALAVAQAESEESEAPPLHHAASKRAAARSEAPPLHTPSEAPPLSSNSQPEEDETCADCPAQRTPDDDVIESMLEKIRSAPEKTMSYIVTMPSGPAGEEQHHAFPVKFSPSQAAALEHFEKDPKAGQASLLSAIYQARPHILGLKKPWGCSICGRDATTTIGSPAYTRIKGTDHMIIVDAAPFVLCGSQDCENEAQRRTREIIKSKGLIAS